MPVPARSSYRSRRWPREDAPLRVRRRARLRRPRRDAALRLHRLEAASGLQLRASRTASVAFGVLTVDVKEQALARISKGAEAVRTALEMADAFAQLRASAR
jgi:hypothetical protein